MEDNEGCFWVWFALCALSGLAMTAVIIWAVIQVVAWLTTQTI